MPISPLDFARSWEQTCSAVQECPAADLRLLTLAQFWPLLRQRVSDPAYASYFDEFVELYLQACAALRTADFTPDELESLTGVADECAVVRGDARLVELRRALRHRRATLLFQLGDLETALNLSRELSGSKSEFAPDPEAVSGLYAQDSLAELTRQAEEHDPALHALLKEILDEWLLEHEAGADNAVNCLFVERTTSPATLRGRMRTLQCEIELGRDRRKADEVTFQMQVIAVDDSFVGAVHQSLTAVRTALLRQGVRIADGRRIRAHFRVADAAEKFTGDSIGLGAALIAYTQILKAAALRHDRTIACDAAVTGVIDAAGNLEPANPATIGVKIERAFYSRVRYVIVPEANLAAARERLRELTERYPRRQLILIGASALTDVIADHNVVRSQKVCIGDFVARRASRLARMTSVQIPLLLLVLFFLMCLLFPKVSPFFHWNPASLQIRDTRIVALNEKGQSVWTHDFGYPMFADSLQYCLGNLDLDPETEVVYMPRTDNAVPQTGQLFVFDDDGTLLFQRDGWISHVYPTDSVPSGINKKEPRPLPYLARYRGESVIVTVINDIYPARGYIKFWNKTGDLLGWLIFSGTASLFWAEDHDYDGVEEFAFVGFCNRMGCQTFFEVDPLGLAGVSPPYWNRDIDLRFVPRVESPHWVFLLPSRVMEFSGVRDYQTGGSASHQDSCRFNFQTQEGRPMDGPQVDYQIDCDFRVRQVLFSDSYAKKFRQLVASGDLPPVSRTEWADTVRNLVTYYRDGRLVTEGELRAAEEISAQ